MNPRAIGTISQRGPASGCHILLHATLNAGPAMGLSPFTVPASSQAIAALKEEGTLALGPERTALIVIDVQRYFVEPEHAFGARDGRRQRPGRYLKARAELLRGPNPSHTESVQVQETKPPPLVSEDFGDPDLHALIDPREDLSCLADPEWVVARGRLPVYELDRRRARAAAVDGS